MIQSPQLPTSKYKSTKMTTGPHPVYGGESSMIPHVLDIYDKAGKKVKTTGPYSSFKKALDIAKNYSDIPEGGRAFPRISPKGNPDVEIGSPSKEKDGSS